MVWSLKFPSILEEEACMHTCFILFFNCNDSKEGAPWIAARQSSCAVDLKGAAGGAQRRSNSAILSEWHDVNKEYVEMEQET